MEREINEQEINLERENIIVGGMPTGEYYTKTEVDFLLDEKEQEISAINNEQTTQNTNIAQNTSDITAINNNLINYSLVTETGSQIALSINSSTYVMTATLKDKNGNTIYTSNEIDLPLETMVVGASYDNTTKEIVLTLKNGTTTRFSVADLVNGLVSTSSLTETLSSYYTKTEVDSIVDNNSIKTITQNTNIWSLAQGVYKVNSGVQLSYKTTGYLTAGNYGCVLIVSKAYNNVTPFYFMGRGVLSTDTSGNYIIVGVARNDVYGTFDNYNLQELGRIVHTINDQTINGVKTFNSLPESSAIPTTNNQLVNKAYVDSVAGGGNISVIDYNDTTANNLAVLQSFYNNFKVGKEMVFYYNNLPNNYRSIPMYFMDTDNSTYVDFRGFTSPPYNSSKYGITYKIISNEIVRLNLSNGEVTSYSSMNSTDYLTLTSSYDILGVNNWEPYFPTDDYHPATKKYVDDSIQNLSDIESYSNEETYEVGDYVYFYGVLYKCNTQISVAEDFDSSKWDEATFVDYLSEVLIGNALGGSY